MMLMYMRSLCIGTLKLRKIRNKVRGGDNGKRTRTGMYRRPSI
jgi:hypothetical protein